MQFGINKRKEDDPHGIHSLPIQQMELPVFINIKKYKIMLETTKDYLRIIFFLMAVKDHSFKQVQKYARLRKQ